MFSIIIPLLLFLTNESCWSQVIPDDPELNMKTPDIIQYYGYKCEIHQVPTDDGYILVLHRIPSGLKKSSINQRPVVFLQHGLVDSSYTWVANGPAKSLGFILADNGYDVWLGNTRGNVYSNSHKTFPSNSKQFWDFTWDEMANFDLPAMINYALSVSKTQNLSYVGHSQGTEIGFAKFSQNSNLNSKVSAFAALAPVVYLGHMKTALKYLAGLSGGINLLSNLIGNGEFLPSNQLITNMGQFLCGNQIGSLVCGNVLFLFYGFDTSNLNYTRIPIYLKHIPAGTSTKNIDHYAQSYLFNKFQKYDYGFFGNLANYQKYSPPQYQLNTNGLPIGMFWGGNDWLTVPEDVSRAINELGDNVKFKKFIPEYNHVDFVWGINADTVLFPDVISFLNQYSGTK